MLTGKASFCFGVIPPSATLGPVGIVSPPLARCKIPALAEGFKQMNHPETEASLGCVVTLHLAHLSCDNYPGFQHPTCRE